MSIILLLLGIIVVVCAFVIKQPLVVEYKKWIYLVGMLLVLWGIFGLLVALIVSIVMFLLFHFKVIDL